MSDQRKYLTFSDRSIVPEITRQLPDKVYAVMRDPSLETPILAGGWMRGALSSWVNGPAKDIDLQVFGIDWNIQYIKKKYFDGVHMDTSPTAYTFSGGFGVLPVQFIRNWPLRSFDNSTAEEVMGDLLLSHDFVNTRAALAFKQDGGHYIMWDNRLVNAEVEKRLIWGDPTRDVEKGQSLLRVLRFAKRGYSITTEDLSKIVGRAIETFVPNAANQTGAEIAEHLAERMKGGYNP